MFDFVKCAENTYYLKAFANVGVYYLGGGEVLLIDSGDHKKSVADLDAALCERNWKVKMIINTHSHIDHITGNKFFAEKYGCEIFASETEYMLAKEPNIEGLFYFNAIPIRRLSGGKLTDKGTETKLLTNDVLPEGFETVRLPGHNFNMIGIKTPDDVWFIGDSILMKETFDSYKVPFFLNINESIQTAKMLPSLKGKLFIPAHAPASEDITELALFNAKRLSELKEYFFSICNGRSLEEIIAKADEDFGLKLTPDKYAKCSLTIKSHLQALLNEGRITAVIERSRMVYSAKRSASLR